MKSLRSDRELPPRTRRILPDINQWNNDIGTTSAHAENTPRQHAGMRVCANYLRARGEYGNTPPRANAKWELPPRTRRIPTIALGGLGDLGTTSAHAENTMPKALMAWTRRNYLRARGEYIPMVTILMRFLELPPRTRRIRVSPLSPRRGHGTTSAHAENTRHQGK